MTGGTGMTFTAAPELGVLLRALEKMPPWERCYAAVKMMDEMRAAMPQLAAMRREAVREMRHDGLTNAEIADLIGVGMKEIERLIKTTTRAAGMKEEP